MVGNRETLEAIRGDLIRYEQITEIVCNCRRGIIEDYETIESYPATREVGDDAWFTITEVLEEVGTILHRRKLTGKIRIKCIFGEVLGYETVRKTPAPWKERVS